MSRRPSSQVFSAVAGQYARFRPDYPEALYRTVAAAAGDHACAWDCASGSGQAAFGLARHFERVIATDTSVAQLAAATPHPRIVRAASAAERCALAGESVSLVAVAQALHWFDLPAFLAEAGPVLRPGGVFAVWSYARPRLDDPALQSAIDDLHDGALGRFWRFDRAAVESGYRGWRVFAARPRTCRFVIERDWDVDALIGYLGTWSALADCRASQGHDPLEPVAKRLRAHWGPGRRPVRWPVTLRLGWPAAA